VRSIQTDVLEVYLSEFGGRRDKADNGCRPVRESFVEFNGTITEAKGTDPSERVVVARWSVDLVGRICIKLLGATQSQCFGAIQSQS
jgi:hypothetical protein